LNGQRKILRLKSEKFSYFRKKIIRFWLKILWTSDKNSLASEEKLFMGWRNYPASQRKLSEKENKFHAFLSELFAVFSRKSPQE
jgi:hypothetical protein